MRITLVAPAKVNLWLRVGPRRSDGFHDLDTLFCALDLADDVTLRAGERGRGVRLGVGHGPPLDALPDLGLPEKNLAFRAARMFQGRAGEPANIRIGLTKRIPPGGGLGGGSSDGAAVLRGLLRMHPDALTGEDVQELALQLGSDVPFFLFGRALAHGTGRGERLTALPPLPPRPVVVVVPPFPVSTADAYRWLDEDRGGAPDDGPGADVADADAPVPDDDAADATPGPMLLPTAAGEGAPAVDWEQVEARAGNDFERPVFARHPRLARIRDRLQDAGARIAMLSGSGSTLFGVFPDAEAAQGAADALAGDDPSLVVVVTATRSR